MSDFSDFYTDKENTKRGASWTSWTRRKKSDLRNVYTRRNLLLNPDLLLDFNPVFKREVIRSMRSISAKQRFYICALIALPIFCAYLYSILYSILLFAGSASAIQEIVDIQAVLDMLLLYMLMLVLFFVPGIAATSIVGERERQTLTPLQISLLSPFNIVFGKVLASLFFPMLLALATLPLWLTATLANESITVIYLLTIVIIAFFIASVALLGSAVMDTTLAIIVSYIFAPLAIIVHYIITSLFTSLLRIEILPFWMTDAVATTLVSTLCLWLTSLTLTTPHSGMTTELKAKDVLQLLVAPRLRRYG